MYHQPNEFTLNFIQSSSSNKNMEIINKMQLQQPNQKEYLWMEQQKWTQTNESQK